MIRVTLEGQDTFMFCFVIRRSVKLDSNPRDCDKKDRRYEGRVEEFSIMKLCEKVMRRNLKECCC